MVHRLAVALSLALCCTGYTPVSAQKIDPPRKIKNVDPVYPESAQHARVHGDVVIEATIGVDGKVTGAKVITSIPLLDEAALAAVRQWEYAPTVVGGTPVPVVMTVTVHFSLQESPPPGPAAAGPLVLDRDGNDWTVGGTPLLDDDLRFWLRDVMRTAPEKQLFVHASASSTYNELVDVLSSATAAGVEGLHVFVGNSGPAQAVRVWLVPLAQKVAGINLPVSDVGSQVTKTGVPVSMARGGGTTAAKTAVGGAASGAKVALRIDRSRTAADVWEVLKAGTRRNVEGFALAVQLPAGAATATNAPVSAQQLAEWTKVDKTLSDLVLSDKKTLDDSVAESIPILEKFVARNPNVMDARFKLASAYKFRAIRSGATAETRRRDLESAIRHFAAAAAFFPSEDGRFLTTLEIAQLYEPDALNDKIKGERYAQRLVDEYPGHYLGHMYYARLLHDSGDLGGAVNVMRHGRTVSTMPLVGLVQSIQYVTEYVQAKRDLPREATGQLLQELTAVTDAILANPEKQETDVRLAVMGRVMALDAQAERLADTSAERVRLLVESDRWFDTLAKGTLGVPGPPRKLSEREATELECTALWRWSTGVTDSQPVAAAIASVQRYVGARPSCFGPHQKLADLLTNRAHQSANAPARTADLQHAIDELQQVIDLAPTPYDRNEAFAKVVELSGPKELNRPERADAAAHALLKRSPDDPVAHYAVAAVLFRTGRAGDGEKALRTARTAIKATPSSRGEMARELVRVIDGDSGLPPAAARRLFDEAAALLADAEKLKGGKDDPTLISARIRWLNVSADRFEKDPARAAAQREQAKQLQAHLQEIR